MTSKEIINIGELRDSLRNEQDVFDIRRRLQNSVDLGDIKSFNISGSQSGTIGVDIELWSRPETVVVPCFFSL